MANEDLEVIEINENDLDAFRGQKSSTASDFMSSQSILGSPKRQLDPTLGIYELEFDKWLRNLEMDLKGVVYDERKKEYKKLQNKDPLLPAECTDELIAFLNGILFKNTIMTNLEEERIKMSLLGLQKALDRMLFKFGYLYPTEVKTTTLWALSRACGQQIENALFRAKNGQERILRNASISVNAQQRADFMQEQEKRSVFSNWWGRKQPKTGGIING